MKPAGIADTCFCIDLWHGQLLGILCDLEVQIIIPDVVAAELRNPGIEPFIGSGAEIQSAEPQEVLLVKTLRALYRKPSIADLFSLAMAKTRGAVLLTNDKHLKTAATKENVTVRGILWLLDSLEDRLSGDRLARALEDILVHGAHLPGEECRARLARWRPEK
jgi:predicted nucleic acid-binding protein